MPGASRHAILLPRSFVNMYPDPDYATALARAFNDWLLDTWLTRYNGDGCFRGSLTVAQQDPQAAAAEIERLGGNDCLVQVMVDSGARAPFGQRQYLPIYEQCTAHGLPFAIHPGTDGAGINVQHTQGYPTHLIEWHSLLSLAFQSHLVSFITEGVFERFPEFTVVLVEGGVAWLAPLIWRLTDHWRSMRAEVPWMVRPPLGVPAPQRASHHPAAGEPRRSRAPRGAAAEHRRTADADVRQRLPALRLRLAAGGQPAPFPAPCCRRSCTTTPPASTASVARAPATVDDASACARLRPTKGEPMNKDPSTSAPKPPPRGVASGPAPPYVRRPVGSAR